MRATPITIIPVILALAGCTAQTVEPTDELACVGKCDGLISDFRDIDGDDLAVAGSGVVSEELSNMLETDFAGVELGEPQLFALERDLDDGQFEQVQNIDSLVHDLAMAFGNDELSTHVNQVRRNHLMTTDDEVFAESSFTISAGLSHGMTLDVEGIDEDETEARTRIGLGQGSIQGRVVFAHDSTSTASARAIIQAIRESRGFALPRTVDEVREMEEGEAYALRGDGWVGLNVGAGVPILIADPTSWLTYNIVITAALRAHIEGTLDIQLVRIEDDQVVIDVGTDRARVLAAELAIRDGWGVDGLVDANVSLGGVDVNVGDLVERALQDELNDKLNLVEAEVGRTGRSSRLSLARLRFDLDSRHEHFEEALGQASRGDVRLAQLLARQPGSGVAQEFDVLRSGVSTTSYAALDLFGMSFFRRTTNSDGQVFIETPGGVQTLLFNSHSSRRGSFFSEHGYTRANIAGLTYGADGAAPTGDANLFLQVIEGDKWMQRDKLLDHLDAIIVGIAGWDAFSVLETTGNALEAHVQNGCESDAFNPCYSSILETDFVKDSRADGLRDFEAALPSHVDGDLRSLVLELAQFRLTAQATFEPSASLVGPNTSVFVDARFSDEALERIFADHDGEDLATAVRAYLSTERIDREDTAAQIAADRQRVLERAGDEIEAMVGEFDRARARYNALLQTERRGVDGLNDAVGADALIIPLSIRDGAVDYENATAQSVAQARSTVVQEMYEALFADADGVRGVYPEQLVTYSLFALTPHDQKDLRVDVDMNLNDRWSQDMTQYRDAGYYEIDTYAHGGGVDLIGGGMFDVQATLDTDNL